MELTIAHNLLAFLSFAKSSAKSFRLAISSSKSISSFLSPLSSG